MAQRTIKPIELSDLPTTVQNMKRAAEFDPRMFSFKAVEIFVLFEFKIQIFFAILYLIGFVWLVTHLEFVIGTLLLISAIFAILVSIVGVMILQSRDHKCDTEANTANEKTLNALAHAALFLVWPIATWNLVRKGITRVKRLYPDLRKDTRQALFEDLADGIDHWNEAVASIKALDVKEVKNDHFATKAELIQLEDMLRDAIALTHAHLAKHPLDVPFIELPEDCRKICMLIGEFAFHLDCLCEDDEEESLDAQ